MSTHLFLQILSFYMSTARGHSDPGSARRHVAGPEICGHVHPVGHGGVLRFSCMSVLPILRVRCVTLVGTAPQDWLNL